MGTHPIFESDFDCLTEMRFTARLAGGVTVAESAAVQGKKLASQSLVRVQRYGTFDRIPHRKIYLGPSKIGSNQIFFFGFAVLMYRVYCGMRDEYLNCNYCYSGSSFNMDNIILVDGKYRWIPTKMNYPTHDMASYGFGSEIEQNWTPTDGKGL